MEDAFSPEGSLGAGGGGGGGGTGRGNGQGFCLDGVGTAPREACSVTVQRGNGSGAYRQLATQPVGPAPHLTQLSSRGWSLERRRAGSV
ncbi:unnamed protein product [Miscanthus lutarioriparius]|uniref:Uncharacterized protein n=1 Tax=Miscanthus lutarioriparius TaxID=422564 RepID=A0A811QVU5_9POAL|nr:unnamed protein product [Miscanthus lutarioriparius]